MLKLVNMTAPLERTLTDALQVTEQGSYLALEPGVAQRFISKLKASAERFAQAGATPILLAPAALRSSIYNFTERFIPGYVVISHQEIGPSTKVQSVGVIGFEE